MFVGMACPCYKKHVVAKFTWGGGGEPTNLHESSGRKALVVTPHISIFLLTGELPTWSRVLFEKILPILKCMVAMVASPCI